VGEGLEQFVFGEDVPIDGTGVDPESAAKSAHRQTVRARDLDQVKGRGWRQHHR
jgi:hypothetical protein